MYNGEWIELLAPEWAYIIRCHTLSQSHYIVYMSIEFHFRLEEYCVPSALSTN